MLKTPSVRLWDYPPRTSEGKSFLCPDTAPPSLKIHVSCENILLRRPQKRKLSMPFSNILSGHPPNRKLSISCGGIRHRRPRRESSLCPSVRISLLKEVYSLSIYNITPSPSSPGVITLLHLAVLAVGWLEPLLDRIGRNWTSAVTPVIDVISDDTLEYTYSSFVAVGGFDWNLQVAGRRKVEFAFPHDASQCFW